MKSNALKTLFHPFATGALTAPAQGRRVLFLGAEPGFVLPEGFTASIDCVQGFRPDYLRLKAAGLSVTPQVEGDGNDLALVLCGRHRGENELAVAIALRRTRPAGTVVIAGTKHDGIASLRKRVAALGAPAGSLSKHHAIVFWLVRSADADVVAAGLESANRPGIVDARFVTAPGMFSFREIDPGSRLLADSLPALSGRVADFCAGWGYLAARVAEHPGVVAVDLYEAGHASLEAARDNMARLAPGTPARFFWHDLATEPVAERYDAIVMNPPFHESRAADPSLGQGMIRAAAAALRKGGHLFMVANRGLPYEAALAKSFARVETLREEAGFKVVRAAR